MYSPGMVAGLCEEDAYGEYMDNIWLQERRRYERKGHCHHREDFIAHSREEVECGVCGKTWHPEMYKHEQAKKRRYREATWCELVPSIKEVEDLPF